MWAEQCNTDYENAYNTIAENTPTPGWLSLYRNIYDQISQDMWHYIGFEDCAEFISALVENREPDFVFTGMLEIFQEWKKTGKNQDLLNLYHENQQALGNIDDRREECLLQLKEINENNTEEVNFLLSLINLNLDLKKGILIWKDRDDIVLFQDISTMTIKLESSLKYIQWSPMITINEVDIHNVQSSYAITFEKDGFATISLSTSDWISFSSLYIIPYDYEGNRNNPVFQNN